MNGSLFSTVKLTQMTVLQGCRALVGPAIFGARVTFPSPCQSMEPEGGGIITAHLGELGGFYAGSLSLCRLQERVCSLEARKPYGSHSRDASCWDPLDGFAC